MQKPTGSRYSRRRIALVALLVVVGAVPGCGTPGDRAEQDSNTFPPENTEPTSTTVANGSVPSTSLSKFAACSALTKAGMKEMRALLVLKASIFEKNGQINGHSKSYESAYDRALTAVADANQALSTYKSAQLSLPRGSKFAQDLPQISIDLGNLDAGVRSRQNPYDEWNQLTDYATEAGKIASMSCPA